MSRILVVAGAASGVGKTSITVGLLEAFRSRGLLSYVHIHFASNPSLAPAFVDACAVAAA